MENQAENTHFPLLQKSMCLVVLGFAFSQKTGLLHLFININGFSPTFSEAKKLFRYRTVCADLLNHFIVI